MHHEERKIFIANVEEYKASLRSQTCETATPQSMMDFIAAISLDARTVRGRLSEACYRQQLKMFAVETTAIIEMACEDLHLFHPGRKPPQPFRPEIAQKIYSLGVFLVANPN